MVTANFVISVILSTLTLIVSIIAVVVSIKTFKRQQERDEKRYIDDVKKEALSFIQKYSQTNEIQLTGLAIIASNYNKTFPYNRQFYKEWCILKKDVKVAILEEMDFDKEILFEDKNL